MTQRQQIEEQLNKYGKVSRNWALRRFISRLGAHINMMKNEGWSIIGRYEKKGKGTDFVYYVINA